MLENTFVHIPGVSLEMERDLWRQGCRSWSGLLTGLDAFRYEPVEREAVVRSLKRSVTALETRNHQFFRRHLGPGEAWRAFQEFRDSAVFLDIETDGGNRGSSVTVIGLYDGAEFTALIRDENLGNFPDIISQYSTIVTFAGRSFDIPVLRRRFPLVKFDHIHIDLCPTLHRLGLKGGLKRIEKELGIERGESDGLTGWDAVKLWRRYTNLRDDSALERLIAYNREDVVNMERLADYAYEHLRRGLFESVAEIRA